MGEALQVLGVGIGAAAMVAWGCVGIFIGGALMIFGAFGIKLPNEED